MGGAQQAVERGSPDLAERLGMHQAEITAEIVEALEGIWPRQIIPAESARVVSAAVAFGIEALLPTSLDSPPVPDALVRSAEAAAKARTPLELVFRAYLAGYRIFTHHVIRGTSAANGWRPALYAGLDSAGVQLERVLARVAEEYERAEPHARSGEATQTKLVRQLLSGEVVEADDLNYDFTGWHIAVVTVGVPEAKARLRRFASESDCRLLVAHPDKATTWAWLGRRRELDSGPLLEASMRCLTGLSAAFGEPAPELAGWRLSHRQATAIFPQAQAEPGGPVRYADVGLVATIAKSDILSQSLRQLFLQPLSGEPKHGPPLEDIVRSYLACGRSISSAAAALKLSRQTVRSRVREAEEKLGRSLDRCGTELEIALRLDS